MKNMKNKIKTYNVEFTTAFAGSRYINIVLEAKDENQAEWVARNLCRFGYISNTTETDEVEATSPMGSSKMIWPVDEDGELRSAGWMPLRLHAWQRECIDGKAHLDPMDACGHESKPFPQRV